MYTQHKWFACVSFSNIMDPDIWCCSQEMVFTKLRVKKAQRSCREMKTSSLYQSSLVKHITPITPMKIWLMNNYKYKNNNNNNNNNNNKLYLSVRYFSYEANWGPYEIKRYICTAIKSIIIWSKFFFLFIGREPTMWPANNCLLMCNAVQQCLAANNILLMCKEKPCFSPSCDHSCENGRSLHFPRIFIKKTNSVIKWKTIIHICKARICKAESFSSC